ncbi:probable ADP-ribosylation factor GTPase-activating protein AGD14 isoform X1 [Dioscorea cayenensis subsp. rotundata]|uniref:Probable ADP-ribosylation factor GTPase-activating protein AGD14 isoform X1 n=1 Tax=Dioscorea cayennensis subsp. rotundata TaxID=55577 RepID=A0AB40BFQ9_DIOCR|nr:probable ADP-ribosylation factor GTPase-activating protein AGD14 isoform X1 [Dioscorea cayenensis subsp. rotundata]
MGYAMQYHVGDTMQASPQSAKSSNPFDLASELSLPRPPSFSSLATLAGTLPDMTSDATMPRSASVGALTPQWIVLQQTSYLSDSSPSPYLIQHGLASMSTQVSSNSFPIVNQGAGFGNLGMNQNPSGKKSQPSTPNSLTSGGNPFE